MSGEMAGEPDNEMGGEMDGEMGGGIDGETDEKIDDEMAGEPDEEMGRVQERAVMFHENAQSGNGIRIKKRVAGE